MDWNLKYPSWDLSEISQQNVPGIHSLDGSGCFGSNRENGVFSVDLKLGQMSNPSSESVDKWKETGIVTKSTQSPSGSSKRARGGSNGAQTAYCLVDGCNADLSNCRDYHRRHKVCELHSKTAQVTIAGHKQRFCQQCSRFHSLEEFDEGKRSCRKRLDGHNRRRRKPQPDSMHRSGDIFSKYQGTQLLPFPSSNVYPSTAVGDSSWGGVPSAEAEVDLFSHHHRSHLALKQDLLFGGVKQFKLLTGIKSAPDELASAESCLLSQTTKGAIALSESSGKVGCNHIVYDRSAVLVAESDCALSLLSSSQMQTSGSDFSNRVHPSPNSFPGSDLSNMVVDTVNVSRGNRSNIHSPEIFPMGCEGAGSSGTEVPQTIPFRWG